MPISSIVEAARVPQQLLGELFVEKGLITAEELAEALAEQKETGKRLGQILVRKGFVSGPSLTTVLAEQLGVEMEKQEGFGAGLWSEIKRRHPRTKDHEDTEEPLEPLEPVAPSTPHDRRLAIIDDFDDGAPEEQVDWMALDDGAAELENLRQQLRFASTRLEEERAGHKGTLRLLEESRKERERLAQEVGDWQERAGRAEDSDENEQAVARLAELEAMVAELRAELDVRDGELAAGAEVQTQLAAEAGRLENELKALRDEHGGSKDAIAALTAQVDEVRSELDKARAEAAAFEATVGELREELASRGDTDVLEQELAAVRQELARLEQGSEKRKAKVKELQGLLEDERATSTGEADSRAALENELKALRDEHAGSKDAIGALTAQVDELRAGVGDSQRLLDEARVEAAGLDAALAELRSELDKARKEGSQSHAATLRAARRAARLG